MKENSQKTVFVRYIKFDIACITIKDPSNYNALSSKTIKSIYW